MSTHNNNHFCPYCLVSSKQNYKCGQCGQPTLTISYHARTPKKDAHKSKWKVFFKFFPYILSSAPSTKALKKLGLK
jgi:hypothetical protein